MANRDFNPLRYSIVKRPVDIFATINVGAAGAVTLQKWNYPALNSGTSARNYTAAPATGGGSGFPTRYVQGSEGVFSVVRTGAGAWTLTLQDNYQRLIGLQGFTARPGGVVTVADFSEDTTVSNYQATGGSVIGIVMFNDLDVPGDGASGDQIRLHLILADATEP